MRTKEVSSSTTRKQRIDRSAQQWRDLVREQQRSGLDVETFCRGVGASATAFGKWRRHFAQESATRSTPASRKRDAVSTGEAAPAFVEIAAPVRAAGNGREAQARSRWRNRAGTGARLMPTLPHGVRVYLCTRATDMRKSFDGLIAATKAVIRQDPSSGHLFVFVNRQGNYAKALYFSRGGYCLWAKRLEQGCFAKVAATGDSVVLTDTQLMMWLDGIEMRATVQRKRFALAESTHGSAIMAA
ncbi:MAG: IS66 family insertion sequence element accessory protein TnpB [Gammaproteobacteria bacterium]